MRPASSSWPTPRPTPGIKNAIKAGIRSIDHGIYLDDEAIEMMLARGTWLVPTLVAPRGVIDAADAGAAIPEASVKKAREVAEIAHGLVREGGRSGREGRDGHRLGRHRRTARTCASWRSWSRAA